MTVFHFSYLNILQQHAGSHGMRQVMAYPTLPANTVRETVLGYRIADPHDSRTISSL